MVIRHIFNIYTLITFSLLATFYWKETFYINLASHKNNNFLSHRRTLIEDILNDYLASKVQLFLVNNAAGQTSRFGVAVVSLNVVS
jgi:flagellar basal body-associated protein FliL